MGDHESFTMICVLFFFENVPHIEVEETRLVDINCWSLWDMNDKSITILTVISYYMVFMYQY